VKTVVQHTAEELRRGLQSALDGAIDPQLRTVENELRLAGFLTDVATVTPAGRRFLGITGSIDSSRVAGPDTGRAATT
jgi:hypothetical protein